MTDTRLEEGVTYRVRGTTKKLVWSGDLAPTPDGKPQAYWFLDVKNQTHHAFTAAAVKRVKEKT